MAQVFVSYATADQGAVGPIVSWLQGRGYSFFQSGHAESGIPVGAEWERTLDWELAGSRVFMPLLSPKWLASDWRHAELRIARSRGALRDLVPVVVSGHWVAGGRRTSEKAKTQPPGR
jgi:hypothetical protein